MQKHFFSFRKIINGKPEPIYIEVIVEAFSWKDARDIAEQEMAEMRRGVRELRRTIARREKTVAALPDYRFIGRN